MATATKIEQMSEARAVESPETVSFDEKFRKLSIARSWGKLDEPVPASGQVLLGSLRDGRLRVYSPIRVKFSHERQHVIAEAVELNEFGFGRNVSEAITDLQHAIVELYFTLEKEQGRLGGDLQNVWSKLQKLIRVR